MSIHASGEYAGATQLSAATSVNISGAGAISAIVSGEKVQTVNVDVGSGTFVFGGSAITSMAIAAGDDFTLGAGTNISGLTTLTTDIKGVADLLSDITMPAHNLLSYKMRNSLGQALLLV